MLRGLKQNLVCTRTQKSHGDQSAFECLSISCEGMSQQWPAVGKGAMTETDLGGMAIEPQHKATKQTPHKLENNYTKEVLSLLQKF